MKVVCAICRDHMRLIEGPEGIRYEICHACLRQHWPEQVITGYDSGLPGVAMVLAMVLVIVLAALVAGGSLWVLLDVLEGWLCAG